MSTTMTKESLYIMVEGPTKGGKTWILAKAAKAALEAVKQYEGCNVMFDVSDETMAQIETRIALLEKEVV